MPNSYKKSRVYAYGQGSTILLGQNKMLLEKKWNKADKK